MRANDLIWNYVVSSWLMGEDPPAFDLLSWNADSTRMPAEMHSFYLRSCYLENQLARGVMELAGQRLDIAAVDQDLYFLAAEQDHIAPWRSAYAGARLPAGEVRFVLSNSGPHRRHRQPAEPEVDALGGRRPASCPPTPTTGSTRPTIHPTTWWEDWATWIGARAGELRQAAADGQPQAPAARRRPGSTYVRET